MISQGEGCSFPVEYNNKYPESETKKIIRLQALYLPATSGKINPEPGTQTPESLI